MDASQRVPGKSPASLFGVSKFAQSSPPPLLSQPPIPHPTRSHTHSSCLRRPTGGVALRNKQRPRPPHLPASLPAAPVNSKLPPAQPDVLLPNELPHHHPQCSSNPLPLGRIGELRLPMSAWLRPALTLMRARGHHEPTTQEFEVCKRKRISMNDCWYG